MKPFILIKTTATLAYEVELFLSHKLEDATLMRANPTQIVIIYF